MGVLLTAEKAAAGQFHKYRSDRRHNINTHQILCNPPGVKPKSVNHRDRAQDV